MPNDSTPARPPAAPDVLGDDFTQRTIPLGEDAEGPIVATLVSKPAAQPSRTAVLYVHGYVDYFFQVEMAEQYRAHGFNFYALDLRRYGRSLRPYQTPTFTENVHEYFEEVDAALRIMREDDGNDVILVNGHSTGGLIVALYAHHRRAQRAIDGLFLNSPFFDFNVSTFNRTVGIPLVSALGRYMPRKLIQTRRPPPIYAHSIHSSQRGEWSYDLRWKPIDGFPMHAGWLRAVHRGHKEVQAGLRVPCPVLMMSSGRSTVQTSWADDATRTDLVLDVEHMWRYTPGIADHVTCVRIEGGLHDLMLSSEPVREHIYGELFAWTSTYLRRAREP